MNWSRVARGAHFVVHDAFVGTLHSCAQHPQCPNLYRSRTHMSEHVNLYYRCPGGIRVNSQGSQYVHLLALGSDCPSIQCHHPPLAHRDWAKKVAIVDVGLADDEASHHRSPSIGPVELAVVSCFSP